jgi:molecular chaperone GrpE (heat shock protein)
MRIHIHHFHHPDEATAERLCRIEQMLGALMETIMATMDDLKAAVQRNTEVDSSVTTLLQGISQQLKDAKAANDPAAIQAVIDQLDKNTSTLSDAVTANTPSA